MKHGENTKGNVVLTEGASPLGQGPYPSLLRASLEEVNRSWSLGRPIETRSHRPWLGPLLTLARKLIRRATGWYVEGVTEQQRAFNLALLRALHAMAGQLAATTARWRRLESGSPSSEGDVREATSAPYPPQGHRDRAEDHHRHAEDYFGFELALRGLPGDVKEKQRAYVDCFQGASRVLDIGCGRGDFLELLGEQGIPAVGIDINPAVVEYCRSLGLEAHQADALDYLRALPDGSLGGIFSSQVVEHLEPEYLAELVRLAWQKLAPGAPFVAETINPESFYALSHAFFPDPSHVRPVHPLTLTFLLKSAGFSQVQVRYISPVPPELILSRVEVPSKASREEKTLWKQFNENVEKLNGLLFGYQDYAAIARKPASKGGV